VGVSCLFPLDTSGKEVFVKCAAMVVPKEVEIDVTGQVDLFHKVETFQQAYSLALEHIGAKPLLEARTLMIRDNLFKDFTRPQLYAFTYKHFGEEGLRKVLGGTEGDSGRQYQEKAADELEAVGLPHVAKIVRESAG
jgi:hypothetical protein